MDTLHSVHTFGHVLLIMLKRLINFQCFIGLFPSVWTCAPFFVRPLSDDFAFLFSVHSLRVCVYVLCVIFMFIFYSYLLVYVGCICCMHIEWKMKLPKRSVHNQSIFDVVLISNDFAQQWCDDERLSITEWLVKRC